MIAQIPISSPSKPRCEHYEECIGAKKHLVSTFTPSGHRRDRNFVVQRSSSRRILERLGAAAGQAAFVAGSGYDLMARRPWVFAPTGTTGSDKQAGWRA